VVFIRRSDYTVDVASNGNGAKEMLAGIRLVVDEMRAMRSEMHTEMRAMRADLQNTNSGIKLELEEIREIKADMRKLDADAARDRKEAAEDRRAIRNSLERSIDQAAEDRREAAQDRKETRKAIRTVGGAIIRSLKRIERRLDIRTNGR